jgi:hypothetical protein
VRTAGSSIRRLGQSLDADDVEVDSDADPGVVDDVSEAFEDFSDGFEDPSLSPPLSEPSSPSFDDDAPLFTAARRSFLAQPDPLKWTAGAANAFRTGPEPHNGHCSGAGPWTPWMTSNRRPHAAQS